MFDKKKYFKKYYEEHKDYFKEHRKQSRRSKYYRDTHSKPLDTDLQMERNKEKFGKGYKVRGD